MGNHLHLLLVALDAQACADFYKEIQKKLTDSLKCLLGLHKLRLWEGDPVVAEILDIEAAIKKKAYVYANPARANLVSSISLYPGSSSWEAFNSASSTIEAEVSRLIPWIRQPAIPKAPRRSLSEKQDAFLYEKLIASAGKKRHDLALKPNAWMKTFGIKNEKDINEINDRIRARVNAYEEEAAKKRLDEGKPLIGIEALKRQPILMPHTPKERIRRVFVISSIPELRKAYIVMHNEVSAVCAALYKLWKHGAVALRWPPGVFIPSPGVMASALR